MSETKSNGKAKPAKTSAKPGASVAKASVAGVRARRKTVAKVTAGSAPKSSAAASKPPKTAVGTAKASKSATRAGTRELKDAAKAAKPRKARLVRDSFTMPEREYELLAQMKKRCLARGQAVKKSEVLRAAIVRLSALGDRAIGEAIAGLDPIRVGRPRKEPR